LNFEVPLTYLITKGELTPLNFEQRKNEIVETVAAAVRANISMVQVREKLITSKQLFELSRDCASAVAGTETKLLVNGRPDVASAAGAHGVHLPEDGLPVASVRKAFPPPFLIGASVHGLEAALHAKAGGADFVVFGPVFDSGGKTGRGLNELETTCAGLGDFPVIAIGGIDEHNKELVLQSAAAGFAAIRYLNHLVSER
jgi:thiamine-phosphate pyrophosphorylase